VFDGAKSLSLDDPAGWRGLTTSNEDTGDGELSALEAYRLVPYLYRGIDLRAKALSGMPWRLERTHDGRGELREPEDVTNDPMYRNVTSGIRQRLYLTEAGLCLYGAGYWLKETNRLGRNLALRWALPTSMQPMYDPDVGLSYFQRTVTLDSPGSGQVQQLGLDKVCYFWLPNLGAEVGPGVAPVRVALGAAGMLYNLDLFATGFFRRGAVKMTLLAVDGNPPRAELDRLELWWKRMVAGVRRAWESVAIRSSVKPVVIGDGLGDTVNETMTTQRREDVCAAIGVPHSLISADAANYATSQQDTLNFYQQTVVPQALLVEEVMNDQVLAEMGLRWRFFPEKLEVFQRAELEKAAQVYSLVGRPVLTVREGRDLMGYDPDEEPEDPKELQRRSQEFREQQEYAKTHSINEVRQKFHGTKALWDERGAMLASDRLPPQPKQQPVDPRMAQELRDRQFAETWEIRGPEQQRQQRRQERQQQEYQQQEPRQGGGHPLFEAVADSLEEDADDQAEAQADDDQAEAQADDEDM
jgi:hypothetical protein